MLSPRTLAHTPTTPPLQGLTAGETAYQHASTAYTRRLVLLSTQAFALGRDAEVRKEYKKKVHFYKKGWRLWEIAYGMDANIKKVWG